MAIVCSLKGGDVDIEFPMTMEAFTMGMNFELAKIRGMPMGIQSHTFEPLSLEFGLITDDILSSDFKMGIKGTADLIQRCEQIYKAAIPPRDGEGAIIGHPLILTIADWFNAEGFITNVNIEFHAPWDESGKPHVADVSLMYEPVMVVEKENTPDQYRRVFRDEFSNFKNIKSKLK